MSCGRCGVFGHNARTCATTTAEGRMDPAQARAVVVPPVPEALEDLLEEARAGAHVDPSPAIG